MMRHNLDTIDKLYENINHEYINIILGDVINGARKSANDYYTSDILKEITDLGYQVNQSVYTKIKFNNKDDVSLALKYLLKRIIDVYNKNQDALLQKKINMQLEELNLKITSNPKIAKGLNNKYYYLTNQTFNYDESIITVFEDGSYEKKEKLTKHHDNFTIIKYDKNDNIINVKLSRKNNCVYKNKEYVAQQLNLKKELVNKFKLRDCSNSLVNFVKTIANKFYKPVPSNCYFDSKFRIYKWNNAKSQFELQIKRNINPNKLPVPDYDIKDSVIIRTDYY